MKSQITRQDAFSLLEGLTDRSLTFGCLLKCQERLWMMVETSKPPYDAVVRCIDLKDPKPDGISYVKKVGCEVLGHPITLVGILEKMYIQIGVDVGHGQRARINNDTIMELIGLWGQFELSTPLRDILEGAEWEEAKCEVLDPSRCSDYLKACEVCVERYKRDGAGLPCKFEVLKDEKVEALILSIQSLGL